MKSILMAALCLLLGQVTHASAYEIYPPDQFTGTSDKGLAVGCVRNGTAGVFSKPTFHCIFKRGSLSVNASSSRGGGNFVCDIDGNGELRQCLPESYAEKQIFIKTDASQTGLVSCGTSFDTLGRLDQLICAQFYNNEAGPTGVPDGWQNVADCRGPTDLRVLLQKRVTATKDFEYTLGAFDGVSHSTLLQGVPVFESETRAGSQFAARAPNAQTLSFSLDLKALTPGTYKISAQFNSQPVNCEVRR